MLAANRPLTRSRRWEKNKSGCVTVHQDGDPSLPVMWVTPRASKRIRANAGKSAHHLPFVGPGWKHSLARASTAQNASLTSWPTSKACGPMHGPSQTWIGEASAFMRSRMACTATSMTPSPISPAKPRQPACAAATHCPEGSANKTGKQSATMMVQASPDTWVMQTSAEMPSGV